MSNSITTERTCKVCGASFEVLNRVLRQGRGHCCSRRCASISANYPNGNHDLKQEVIRLRIEERKSGHDIAAIIGIPKETVYSWLRPYPLTKQERHQRYVKTGSARLKDRGEESKYHKAIDATQLSTRQKGAVAEAAVLFRLALHGFNIFSSSFDGDTTDWLVEDLETRAIHRIQVKWVNASNSHGLPTITLHHIVYAGGRYTTARYKEGDFDFIVGYDLYTDIAYVFSASEVQHHRKCITIQSSAAERWDKLRS